MSMGLPMILEWTAVVLNLTFTIGIALEKRWGWAPGFFASLIGVFLYAEQHTWALMVLNGYYVVMAVYGYWSWGRGGTDVPVHERGTFFHVAMLVGCTLMTAVIAWLLHDQLNGRYPQLDAYISVFSLAATWMMARKLLENWVYWLVGDAVAVYLNWRIGYDAYALLNIGYIGLSIAGFVRWSRAYRARRGVA